MATKRMLIDAAHPEEIRVAVMDGNTLEELDVESAARRQLKGNIYLAKVTRVEPSLQAAFVEYGGNRHGFLAFSEIHPDYYQIPIADREELLAEVSAASENDDVDDDVEDENAENGDNGKSVETIGGDDIDEVGTRRNFYPAKRYKIQEVIKRRQILLIQVVKEERGNKGAALTTYMSLAGRYCVLMPNTGKGGGISRKIASGSDRKRLKSIISEFDIPQGMAVIVRTAGADRSKAEVKRDYEYLIKLWSGVRDLTLKSVAPALIHEEASIIKRAVRDHYSKDIEEVIIEGDDGYRQAKDLMKMLVPSHAKKVQPYKDPIVPLFSRYNIEAQLETMNSPQVQLNSGGYIVIDITEALIAIDVNSGRATRGRNIEETAFKTNTEAATEVARQLRLRDLAGLIVIDFIDMEVHRNQTSVERRLKEAMRKDRARIQIGRISPFGLLELSRQRLRPSITETMTEACTHCGGSGIRRSIESTALHVLRGVEEEGARQRVKEIEVFVHSQVALYILNQKRKAIAEIEQKFDLRVIILEDDNLIPPDFSINRTVANKQGHPDSRAEFRAGSRSKSQSSDELENQAVPFDTDETDEDQPKKKRRRRPRHRRREEENGAQVGQVANSKTNEEGKAEVQTEGAAPNSETPNPETVGDDTERPARRRRGRRGGRRRNRSTEATEASSETSAETPNDASADISVDTAESSGKDESPAVSVESAETGEKSDSSSGSDEKPKRRRVRRKKADAPKGDNTAPETSESTENSEAQQEAPQPAVEATPEPAQDARPAKATTMAPRPETETEIEPSYNPNVTVVGEAENPMPGDNRGGWWNKITGN